MSDRLLCPADIVERYGCTVRMAHKIMRQAGAAKRAYGLRIDKESLTKWEQRRSTEYAVRRELTPGCAPMREPPERPGVYAVRQGDMLKIGKSRNVRARFAQLQAASPLRLAFVGLLSEDQDDERSFHERFSRWRKRGEWFALKPELISEIEAALVEREGRER